MKIRRREITKIFLNFTPVYTAKIAVYAGVLFDFSFFVRNFMLRNDVEEGMKS